MMDLLAYFPHILIYMDDVLIIHQKGESYEAHLDRLDEILTILENAGFRANSRECSLMEKGNTRVTSSLRKESTPDRRNNKNFWDG